MFFFKKDSNIKPVSKGKNPNRKESQRSPRIPRSQLPPPSWQKWGIFHWNWPLFFHFRKLAGEAGRWENHSQAPPPSQGWGLLPAAWGGKLPEFVFHLFKAQLCSLSLSTNIRDWPVPNWTSALQDSNLSFLKRMPPLRLKIKNTKKDPFKDS